MASAPTPRGGTRDGTPGRLALRVVAESRRDCPGQRRTAERLRQRVRGNEWELRQRSSPKGSSTSDNPSVALRATAPFTQGSHRDVGIRPFLTMDGDSGRRGRRPLRKVYRSPSNGPMWSSASTGGCGDRPATAGAALSEAESAERAAGQIQVLPDDLRVQHGAHGLEV